MPELTEAQWQSLVREIGKAYGWMMYHTHRSDRSDAGWPDLVFCKPPRTVFVELKSEKGKVSADQAKWLRALAGCGFEVDVWRPSDLELVKAVLGPREQRAALDASRVGTMPTTTSTRRRGQRK